MERCREYRHKDSLFSGTSRRADKAIFSSTTGALARAVAFEHLLHDGGSLARRLLSRFSEEPQESELSHIATDGETYGHHHRHGEMALSFALDLIQAEPMVRLTNYGEFLERFPPQQEVRIVEGTSWSCQHGIRALAW